ncbi:VOC family protein [Micromonospora sp. NBC_01813]|uniref:VOC family protein n=1 Tax=Micromonospora sp. NBC_01813 TaxID=2975988 RepID=UPI002DD86D8E|nr:VOC family protein [Micromonospora sp. NBC_01813]WSA10906.1 VOC family protein [Micromonospora sp. NBC_01813]
MASIQPIISTPDLPRLQKFYETLLCAEQVLRQPADGPAFYVGLRHGESEFGIVNEERADLSAPARVLLSIDVDDVDALLGQVEAAGGTVLAPPNDMPWGQRVAHLADPDGNLINLTHQL